MMAVDQCDRCGGTAFQDTPVHDSQSTRRDCATCGRTHSFPRWYGRNQLAQQERLQRILDRVPEVKPASKFDYQQATEVATGQLLGPPWVLPGGPARRGGRRSTAN